KLMGILNGTTNHILTEMADFGKSFSVALQEAQAQGYAEADPSNDVDGIDTLYKISILAAIAFGKQIPLDQVFREGIRRVSADDMKYADMLGFTVKLLGIVEQATPGKVLVRVHPSLVPKDHQLSAVKGVYNAVWLHGDFVGDLMFSGRGAGADPTASAVVGDLVDVVRNIVAGGQGSAIPYGDGAVCSPIGDLMTRYYLRLEVVDKPGTLGQITTEFGSQGVGLASMEMRPKASGLGEIVFLTHVCREADFTAAVDIVAASAAVSKVENWMRVEE
ncbi:MAG: homoserine dehydrogenase, partial [Armatimonadota bacterium]